MRALKILTIVMGIMIVGGLAALVAAIIGGATKNRPGATAAFTTAPAIDIPAGARIEAMAAESNRLILDLVLADGTRQLLVVDLASGKKLGVIPLHQGP